MDKEKLSKLINSRKVHQIRAGEKHRFIDISIVEVCGRFFVRRYKFEKRNWYDAFLQNPDGAIKCGDQIIPVKGVVPLDQEQLKSSVTRAFCKKYPIIYAIMRMSFDPKHEASTLELIPTTGTKCH